MVSNSSRIVSACRLRSEIMGIVPLVGFWVCVIAASLPCDLHSWLQLAVVLGPALLAVLRYGGIGSWVVSSGTVTPSGRSFYRYHAGKNITVG